MAIIWGGWHGHLRVGIEYAYEYINSNTTSVTMWCDTYVQCDNAFNFSDSQTITLFGAYGGSYNFFNGLQANQTLRAANPTKVVTPGSSHTTTARLSGAYNGAAPEVTVSITLPNRPPPPNSPPYAPILDSPVWDAVVDAQNTPTTFRWTFRDPDGGPQGAAVLRLQSPSGQWYRWNGTSIVSDDGLAVSLTGSTTELTIPSGKFPASGRWLWTIHTRDNSGLWGPEQTPNPLFISNPPSVSVNAPAHPSTVPRPQVRWTTSDSDGTSQNGWQAQIVKSSVYNDAGYNPESWTGQVWGYSGSGTATSATPNVDLPNHTTMRAYVKVNSSPFPSGGLQYSQWAFKQFDLHVAPFASSITFPSNGGVVDLQVGFTMTWTNSFYVGTGGNSSSQAAFAIRRKQGTSAYEWWNGSSWQTTEYFLPGTSSSYAFRAGEVANGVAWNFAVAIRDGFGGVSPYSTGVTVTGSTAAQVTVTQPANVITITNPVIQWSMYDAENDPQQTYQVRLVNKSVYDLGISDPLAAVAVWDTGELVDATTRQVEVPVDLENGNEYRAYVRVKTTGVYSGWSYTQFIVSLQPPAQPDLVLTVLDDEGAVQIDIQGRDSMLSVEASRSTAGWATMTNSVMGTPQTYNDAQSGSALRFSSAAAGDFSIRTADNILVAPGVTYTAAVNLLAVSSGLDFRIDIEWLDASLAVIGRSFGNINNDATAVRGFTVDISPERAAFARLVISVLGASGAGQAHDLFDPVLRPGNGIEWSPGGLLGNTSVSVVAQHPYRIVRRGLNIPMSVESQRITIRDEEVPIGRLQVYGAVARAVYPHAILASATTLTDPVLWTSGWLWLSDPLRPGTARAWGPQSFGAVTRPVRQGKFRPIGRPDAVLTTGVRGLREGSFTIVTDSRSARETYADLTDRSETILMRIPPDQGETEGETIYVRFEDDSPYDRPLPSRTPHRTITQKWVEQRRPVTNLAYDDNFVLSSVGIQVFVGLDTDGTPYYDDHTPAEQTTVAMARDSDGALVFEDYAE